MQHISDDDLILGYYGETVEGAGDHLAACPDCRARYQGLQRVLNVVDLPVPERSASYGDEVWSRLSPKLRLRQKWSWVRPQRWLAVAAMAALVVGAFVLGRFLPGTSQVEVAEETAGNERVLTSAVGRHLERSQLVLAELVNATDPDGDSTLNIEAERTRARTLVDANRLYRTAAKANGDAGMAILLDDLERVLLEIAQSPEAIPTADLDALRERVDRQGLLFKIRVFGERLKQETPESGVSEKL